MSGDHRDYCVGCGEPVHFGSGNYVNRVPADGGFLCGACAEPIGYNHERTGDFYCDVCAFDHEEEIGNALLDLEQVYADDVTEPQTCCKCSRRCE